MLVYPEKKINCFPIRIKETFSPIFFSLSVREAAKMYTHAKKQILPKRPLKKVSYCFSAVPPYTVDRIPFSPVFSIPRQSSCVIDRESPANMSCWGRGKYLSLRGLSKQKKSLGTRKMLGSAAYLSWVNRLAGCRFVQHALVGNAFFSPFLLDFFGKTPKREDRPNKTQL